MVTIVDSLHSFGLRPISFNDSDMLKIQSPHFDPLVISVWICNSQVYRVLTDRGSSMGVLFNDTFRRIVLSDEWLQLGKEPLVRFDGKPSLPRGSIVLHVTAIEKLLQVCGYGCRFGI